VIDHRFTSDAIHLLRFETGSDLIDSLTEFATERDIRSASVTFLGAVRHAALRYYDQEQKDYRDFAIDNHLEVLSGIGNISVLDGSPFVHAHAAFADADGNAYGGHINRGTEVFALEATLWELEGPAPTRQFDEVTGLFLWGPAG
jgi:predicted DNA-binding protein with PD1-like motif